MPSPRFAAAAAATRRDDLLLHVGAEAAPHRQREVVRRRPLGLGQRAGLVTEIAEGGLQVQRGHVVGRGGDAGVLQRRCDRRALRGADDVHVVDVARVVERQLDMVAEAELRVAGGRLPTAVVPPGEVGQKDPQRRGLDGVEPRVRPDQLERLLVARAVEAKHAETLRDLVVADGDEPAVTEREEILRREEAERRADAGACDAGCAERLCGVLDQRQPQAGELGERRRPAEEVDGHDRLRARRDQWRDSRPDRG